MLLRTSAMVGAVVLSGLLGAQPANAAGVHIDEVVLALREDAARVCNELYYHFRGARQFDHLYRDAYEMYQAADHLHDLVHERGSAAQMREDLARLDELFHHFEELVGELEAGRPRMVHRGGYHSTSRYYVDRLKRLMADMSENLHHLQEDLGPAVGPASVPSVPLEPVGGRRRDRVGIRIDLGRGSLSVF